MKAINENLKLAMLVGLGIVVLGVAKAGWDFYSYVNDEIPKLENERAALTKKINEKKANLSRLANFAKNIEDIKKDLRELNSKLETALERLPRTFNLSGLLRRLDMLAQNSGLDFATFKPRTDIPAETSTFYTSISIDFQVRGTFTQTLTFLDQLTRLKRIVNVETLAMSAEKGKQRLGTLVATTNATIRAYRFSE